MAAPQITPLPTPPVRSDAPADFSSKADALVAALPPMVTQANAQADFNDQRATDSESSATASAGSAAAASQSALDATTNGAAQVALAADQVTLAESQVALATDQAELATTNGAVQVALATDQAVLATSQAELATQEADRSQSAADSAEVFAAAAGAAAGLPALTGNAGKFLAVRFDETGVEFRPVGSLIRSERTSNTQIVSSDVTAFVDITSGTFTQTFVSAAALGEGWYCYLRNSGSGDITLTPDSSTIDGLASFVMYPGEMRLIQCDGVVLRSVVINSFYKTFTVSGTFIKPPGYSSFQGMMWGGGGSGGSGNSTNISCSGGGGSACLPFSLLTKDLLSSVSVIVGSGGSAVSGVSGAAGGISDFGGLFSIAGASGGLAGGASVVGGAASALSDLPSTVRYNGSVGGSVTGFAAAPGCSGRYGAAGGGSGSNSSSQGGSSTFGGSGGNGATGSETPTAGSAPGGGGGGVRYNDVANRPSGAGARGEVRIWGVV